MVSALMDVPCKAREEDEAELPQAVVFHRWGNAEGPRMKVVEGVDWVVDKGGPVVKLICPGSIHPM